MRLRAMSYKLRANSEHPLARSSQIAVRSPSLLLPHDRDLSIRPEFLVIAISLFDILVVAFEQRHARVEMKLNKFGQPNFIIHSGQFDENTRAFVDSRKHEPDRYCVNGRYVKLYPLRLRLVNPDAPFELAQDPGIAPLGFVAGTRFAFQHPGIAPVENLGADQAEVECVSDLQNELTVFFATFFFALHSFAPVRFGFVLAFVDNLLNLLVFLFRLVGRQGLVILGGQPRDWFPVDFKDLRSPRFNLPDRSVTIEYVLFSTLDVGVIALLFFVLNVLLFGAAQKFPNLLRRHGAGSIGLQIDGRQNEYVGSRSDRRLRI